MSSRASTERSTRNRVRDRNSLFRELGRAVEPDGGSTVLVLIGFEGMRDYLEARPEEEGDLLLDQLGRRLAEAVEGAGSVYTSRRGEFCVLCEGGLGAVRSILVLLPPQLDEVGRPVGLRSALGIAVLPDEATLPTYALALADRRIRALSGEMRADVR